MSPEDLKVGSKVTMNGRTGFVSGWYLDSNGVCIVQVSLPGRETEVNVPLESIKEATK